MSRYNAVASRSQLHVYKQTKTRFFFSQNLDLTNFNLHLVMRFTFNEDIYKNFVENHLNIIFNRFYIIKRNLEIL